MWVHSFPEPTVPTDALGNLKRWSGTKTGRISAKWHFSHPRSCYSFYMLTEAWSWIRNQSNAENNWAVQEWMCGLVHIFSPSWSASSNQLTHTDACTHAQICMHPRWFACTCTQPRACIRRQRCTQKLQKRPHALLILAQSALGKWANLANQHGVSIDSVLCSPN